jgi:hypothetical protein
MTTDETTTLARSFYDELDQLPTEIPGATTLEPGRINWYHGVKAAKLPGVFYARDTAFTDVPGDPWTLDERYSDAGELGYCAAELTIAFLGWRDQWFLPGENRDDKSTWLPTYAEGAKKLTEYLIRVEGLPDPMVLSVSGLYKARPIIDLVSAFRRGALTQAMRKTKRTLPLWAFWLPIASRRNRDGKVEYLEAKDADGKEYGSVVTPPALSGAPIPRSVAEIMADAALWQEFRDAGWFDYKRVPQGTVDTYTVTSAPALPPGRNTPRAMTDQELASLEATQAVDVL